jgi:hypothetical protein
LEVFVNNINDDPFAQVTQGFLKIDAPYFRICRCNIHSVFFDCHEEINYPQHVSWAVTDARDFKDRHLTEFETLENLACQEYSGSLHQQLVYLYVATMVGQFEKATVFALILEAVGPEKPDVYQRVGLAALNHRLTPVESENVWRMFYDRPAKQPTISLKLWPRKTVTII